MTERRGTADGDDKTDAPADASPDGTPPSEPVTVSHLDPASVRIIAAVAAATDTAPLELPPLGETIDPDAVDDLFDRAGRDQELAFDYAGARVTVRTGEPIQVETETSD